MPPLFIRPLHNQTFFKQATPKPYTKTPRNHKMRTTKAINKEQNKNRANTKKQTHLSNPSIMADSNGYTQQTDQRKPTLQSLFHALDPISLILSQNTSNSHRPVPLKLTTESYYIMERGPRYREYAELRESKLRMQRLRQQEREESDLKQTPPKKQVKFQANLASSRKAPSVLAQSVPDFSATLRKENRKPPPQMQELTPPSKNWSRNNGILSNSRGSKSASAGEKKNGNGGLRARKSYASMEELKGLSMAASNAINGESRGDRGNRGIGKTLFGYRQF